MDGDPPPSEGVEESTAREDETQEVSETPEVSEAREVSDTQEESGEVMEVSYAEAATAAYRDTTQPLLSSREETDGETVGQEGHNVSHDGITLAALQSAIEFVTSEARDDAQAQGAAHTPMLADICDPALEDAQEGTSAGHPEPGRENFLCVDGKECVQLEDSVELLSEDFPQS